MPELYRHDGFVSGTPPYLPTFGWATAWLFRVARNRIVDMFRKRQPATFSEVERGSDEDNMPSFADLLPSPDAVPDALYARQMLLGEVAAALDELPREQREVFVAHELEGRSFAEIAAATGVKMITLLARKRYAVLHLREKLQRIHEEFVGRSQVSESRSFDGLRTGSGAPRFDVRK